TGALFACPLTPELSDCWRVPIDEGGELQDLSVRDELDGGEWKFCEGRPQGHERFGTCQQGLAAAFSPDRRYCPSPVSVAVAGLLFVTNIESAGPDQRVFRTPQPGERVPGAAADVAHNSYLGSCV
ncbi:ITA7 protein, partial [Aegithalos caudatus]|nr:ITA7 protein [Aegithalos caudatus]